MIGAMIVNPIVIVWNVAAANRDLYVFRNINQEKVRGPMEGRGGMETFFRLQIEQECGSYIRIQSESKFQNVWRATQGFP